MHKTREFEDKLAEVKERAWEEFKTSEECDRIKGEHVLGAYLHAFKEAQAFLPKLPDVSLDDLKMVPFIVDTLEFLGSRIEKLAGMMWGMTSRKMMFRLISLTSTLILVK